jgi:hypothetical protein
VTPRNFRPDPEIPNSRSPDSRFGRETGRESPFPDPAGIGKPPFPDHDSAGNGKRRGPRLAANREIGDAPPCEYSGHDPGPDVALSPSMQILASPRAPPRVSASARRSGTLS